MDEPYSQADHDEAVEVGGLVILLCMLPVIAAVLGFVTYRAIHALAVGFAAALVYAAVAA